MNGLKCILFLLTSLLMLPGLLRGQCDPLPLPYTTDLLTGFQPPSDHPTGFEYPWTEGLYSNNCWAGYLGFGGDPHYAYPLTANSARGRFGFNIYVDGQAWPNYAEMAVKDSTHHGVAMLIAPVFVTAPAAIWVHGRLERYFNPSAPYPEGSEEERYWGCLEMGWVTDMAHPEESFLHTGTFAIRSFPLGDASLYHLCIPLHGNPPAGSHFALRMRSKAQGPAQNYVSTNYFYYEFEIWQITMDTAASQPPASTDTVYITDSICQYSAYERNGISLSASETADTGTRTFVLHDYVFYSSDSSLCHVKVLTLKVLPSSITFVRDSIFPGDAYAFGGEELTLAGSYVNDLGLNAYGCPVKDSLVLTIRRLSPMDCGADIGVEQTEWYISQPATVHLWAEQEEGSYLWSPAGLFDNDTARNVSLVLQPESEQWVRLATERTDSVNHIYRGDAIDTMAQLLQLTVPVEPQTPYRLEATLGDGGAVPVQVALGNQVLMDSTLADGRLRLELSSYQYSQITLSILAQQFVRMTGLSLRRFCRAEDSVHLTARGVLPRIGADRTDICLGDSVVLRAEQTDYYRWDMRPADTAFDGCQGCMSLTVSPRVTTTYCLLTPGGEVADSVVVVVHEYPEVIVVADREVVDFDHPVLMLEERSGVSSVRWSFSDGGEAEGDRVRWHFGDVAGDSLWVRVECCTDPGCCADSLLVFPIGRASVWFPNAFTPGAETNNRFAMVTDQVVEAYEMTIYSREGLLVARVADVAAGWDGRDGQGTACPQGAYAYICEYRLAGGLAKRYLGTVLLLR